MVKKEKEPDRVLIPGKPDYEKVDNKVVTARYTVFTFFPVAILQQFRRFANLYFLIVGFIMAIGWYTDAFESALTPWTTLGPLAVVIAISLLVEGSSDYKRHLNDAVTNNTPCVVLRRTDELEEDETAQRDEHVMKGKDVIVNINKAYYQTTSGPKGHNRNNIASVNEQDAINVAIGFEKVRRMDIRQGHFVLIKNREMAPADMLLMASSNDQGSAYIETSSIDGETNLKLRIRPTLPKDVMDKLRAGGEAQIAEKLRESKRSMRSMSHELTSISESRTEEPKSDGGDFETLDEAVKRLTRFSYLGRPDGESALDHPSYGNVEGGGAEDGGPSGRRSTRFQSGRGLPLPILGKSIRQLGSDGIDQIRRFSTAMPKYAPRQISAIHDGRYISALTTEPPNPSVHTFQGKLTLPPFATDGECIDVPLGADNVILRGAVIRNTEWVIGVAFFTGTDTKLVQNSFETPAKFSQLDILMNYIVVAILVLMICCVAFLSTAATMATTDQFDDLFYVGLNTRAMEPWPYLKDLPPPEWTTSQPNWIQYFFLYITLLNQFVPLSLYITVEIVTFIMLWFIFVDIDMYDNTTNTCALARSTTVTDLGRVQYIFSDKTGTLTQNVMTFRRCSVDGIAFGAPIQKSRPGEGDQEAQESTPFLQLRHLLVGEIENTPEAPDNTEVLGNGACLTFNAEMFLRIMCLCHTVVVEKDLDEKKDISSGASVTSSTSGTVSLKDRLFGRGKKSKAADLTDPAESADNSPIDGPAYSESQGFDEDNVPLKAKDGAPIGFAYQAESPDEGALVAAASLTYGYQVVTRDSNGITVRVSKPSHLENPRIVEGLQSGNLSLKQIAAETAMGKTADEPRQASYPDPSLEDEHRLESWSILAVNKFDSTRKRMSILLRSPQELGSVPILFCKGADSAMLDSKVCTGCQLVGSVDPSSQCSRSQEMSALSTLSEDDDEKEDGGDVDQEGCSICHMLGLQAHLGDFASEGLRTLVLGLRVLTEAECYRWMAQYHAATTSMADREKLMTEAAMSIEKTLHIVGATAIEDKLQVGVPDTISTLGKAGIKLWVLTGDKRETAIEIGYSTAVLTPKMSVTVVGDEGKHHVRTQMSMEFISLVKKGKLSDYQKAMCDPNNKKTLMESWSFIFAKSMRVLYRLFVRILGACFSLCCYHGKAEHLKEVADSSLAAESGIVPAIERRWRVRQRAEKTIELWLKSGKGKTSRSRTQSFTAKSFRTKRAGSEEQDLNDDLSLVSSDKPVVFNRAASARFLLSEMRATAKMTHSDLQRVSMAHQTAQEYLRHEADAIVDEDALSLASFPPGDNKEDLEGIFDKRKRTMLERMFAVDRQVRKGQLKKHVHKEKLVALEQQQTPGGAASSRGSVYNPNMGDGPRALVIEGAALKHLLGDKELEEILFAVASVCDSVIACRVSPKQKAELVNLVRHNAKPTPITLAIGDGANDVGMIQEAHVGIGISGKEGTQAVNAADFAISQFRFLKTLVLVHGRWNFFRLSTIVLYSFYKNAVQAGIMIVFNFRTVFSGQPFFDQWLIASLNFVCGAPIIFTGIFDRCLSKEYVLENPEVYAATRDNQMITKRTLLRWVITAVSHICILYFFTVPPSQGGGSMTSAFVGLMRNEPDENPGNGEGGDWRSVGTVTFTCMVILLAYKVLFESRSLVHGRWPAIRCSKNADSLLNRLAYTWIGVTWLSIGFYFVFIAVYQLMGRFGTSSLSPFVDMADHVLGTRSINWLLIAFVPIFGMAFDVTFKTFSNMFFPTQTQIHMEIEAMGKRKRKRALREAAMASPGTMEAEAAEKKSKDGKIHGENEQIFPAL